MAVSRAFFVARNAEEKQKAIETRFANQQRLVKADATADGKKSTASLLSFDQTLDAAGDSALFGTPDEIAAKLDVRLHTHFAENAEDDDFSLATFGCRPMEYLERTGWCSDRVWVAHCVMPNADEILRLGAAGIDAGEVDIECRPGFRRLRRIECQQRTGSRRVT